MKMLRNVESKIRKPSNASSRKQSTDSATLATPESVSPPAEPAPPKMDPIAPLMLKYAHFIVSCLYTWEADPQLDAGIESNGMLLRPAYGCLYGHLDRLHS